MHATGSNNRLPASGRQVQPSPPAPGWRWKAGGLRGARLLVPLAGIGGVFAALAIDGLAVTVWPAAALILAGVTLALVTIGVALLLLVRHRIQQNLLFPLTHLRHWALRMRGGDLSVRIPGEQKGEFAELARDINAIGENLQALSRDMDSRVQKAITRIGQKTRSLEILYEVAATINASQNLNDLLRQFLQILKDVLDARGGAVRLLTGDGYMRLIASDGFDDDLLSRERLVSINQCLCGHAATCGSVQSRDAAVCRNLLERELFESDGGTDVIAVPLLYRERILGVYNLFVERPIPFGREDLNDLLTSIGRHLGMAIEKARLEDEARRLSVMEERTLMAHELHDSLAQTLSSLRFQVRILDETVRTGDRSAALHNIERLANGLDEAHTELRELLTQFRAPIDESGLVPAIQKIVSSFARETGISAFLQQEWRHAQLPVNLEMQLLRIVQEALANARKHSRAQHVRVILRHDESQQTGWLLVEDDGVGFGETEMQGRPGEHMGLSIMEDRARRLGGVLKIESEAGDGTRVMLTFAMPDGVQTATQAAD